MNGALVFLGTVAAYFAVGIVVYGWTKDEWAPFFWPINLLYDLGDWLRRRFRNGT